MAEQITPIQSSFGEGQGLGRAFQQGREKFKQAGDIAKQQGETQRQQRETGLEQRQRQLAQSAEERQRDIELAQNLAKQDLKNIEADYQKKWTDFAQKLQESREITSRNLARSNKDMLSTGTINSLFSGAGNIINSAYSVANKSKARQEQLEFGDARRSAPGSNFIQGRSVQLGSSFGVDPRQGFGQSGFDVAQEQAASQAREQQIFRQQPQTGFQPPTGELRNFGEPTLRATFANALSPQINKAYSDTIATEQEIFQGEGMPAIAKAEFGGQSNIRNIFSGLIGGSLGRF